MRIDFNDEGHLVQEWDYPHKDWREPICPKCTQPIRWVLDMMSFEHNDNGSYTLCHAHCVWLPEAFRNEAQRAKAIQ